MDAVLLSADQKHMHKKISEEYLEHFNKNKTDFVHWFIMMDETGIHHYAPEFKQQSKQWDRIWLFTTKEGKFNSICLLYTSRCV